MSPASSPEHGVKDRRRADIATAAALRYLPPLAPWSPSDLKAPSVLLGNGVMVTLRFLVPSF